MEKTMLKLSRNMYGKPLIFFYTIKNGNPQFELACATGQTWAGCLLLLLKRLSRQHYLRYLFRVRKIKRG